MARTFRRPFYVDPPLEDWEREQGTKETGRTDRAYQKGIDDLWTVVDADGQILSSHKTKDSAYTALEVAQQSL